MRIYNKYFLKELSHSLLIILLVFLLILWLSQSFKSIEMMIDKGIGLWMIIQTSLFLIPSLLNIVLPVACFCSVATIYHKLSKTNEICILKAAGSDNSTIIRPAMQMGIILMIISYFLAGFLAPYAYHKFKQRQQYFKNHYASIILQEKTFTTACDLTIYIDKVRDNLFEGILIHDNRVPARSSTLMAEKGELVQQKDGKTYFYLTGGNRQEKDRKGNISMLYFDNYPLDITRYTQNITKERAAEMEEKNIIALIKEKESNILLENKRKTNLINRLTWPLLTVIICQITAFIVINANFHRNAFSMKAIYLSASVAGGLIACHLLIQNIALRLHIYFLPIIFYAVALIVSFNLETTVSLFSKKYNKLLAGLALSK